MEAIATNILPGIFRLRVYLRNTMARYWVKLLILSCPLIIAVSDASGQHETDYAVQANIIYRFTKYVDWPRYKKSGDFIIGFVGDSPLYDELKSLCAGKTVGDQRLVVTKMSSKASSYGCHILFVCEDESGILQRIITVTDGEPVLIVTEANGLARKGACINFITADEHLKLEINKNSVLQRNLHIASELLELATIIK